MDAHHAMCLMGLCIVLLLLRRPPPTRVSARSSFARPVDTTAASAEHGDKKILLVDDAGDIETFSFAELQRLLYAPVEAALAAQRTRVDTEQLCVSGTCITSASIRGIAGSAPVQLRAQGNQCIKCDGDRCRLAKCTANDTYYLGSA